MKIGAIEAGGTKFVCGIGNEEGVILDRVHFPTMHPDQTMAQVVSYFTEQSVEAIGIGSFGPINLEKTSSQYGFVTTTPKPGWGNYDFIGTIKKYFDVPIGWDTDVNAAAFGEAKWGVARGLDNCVYYTIGTGIGIGIYTEGKLVHGLVHPEGGHILTRRHPHDDFAGCCPYHGDCLEGIAAGPAIEQRWNKKGNELENNHPAWEMEAYYIAQAVVNTILTLSPKKVILGGGVMKQLHLFPMIHTKVKAQLNGYIQHKAISKNIDQYIVPPGLGDNAGLCGALALGLNAFQ
jgi:fructokinase